MEFSLHKSFVVNSGDFTFTSVTFANYNVYLTCLTIINVNGTNSFTLNMCLILKKTLLIVWIYTIVYKYGKVNVKERYHHSGSSTEQMRTLSSAVYFIKSCNTYNIVDIKTFYMEYRRANHQC